MRYELVTTLHDEIPGVTTPVDPGTPPDTGTPPAKTDPQLTGVVYDPATNSVKATVPDYNLDAQNEIAELHVVQVIGDVTQTPQQLVDDTTKTKASVAMTGVRGTDVTVELEGFAPGVCNLAVIAGFAS